jgi:hypothetical protein
MRELISEQERLSNKKNIEPWEGKVEHYSQLRVMLFKDSLW